MALPSPNFRQCQLDLHGYIALQDGKLNILDPASDENRDKIREVFRSVIDDLSRAVLKDCDLKENEIQKISQKMSSATQSILQLEAFQKLDFSEQQKYQVMISDLKRGLECFEKVAAHQKEINQKGLGTYLDQPWAWMQLEQLAKVGNAWALNTLKGLIKNNDERACLFLISNFTNLTDGDLLYTVKDDLCPYVLKRLAGNDPKQKRQVYNLIETILKRQDWPWGLDLLKKNFDTDAQAASTLKNVFISRAGEDESLDELMMRRALQDNPFAIDCLATIFNDHPEKAESLVSPLIELSLQEGHLQFDILLMSLAVLGDSSLFSNLQVFLTILEEKHHPKKKYYQMLLNHLASQALFLRSHFYHFHRDVENIWAHDADYAVVSTYRLLALRLYDLIDTLKGQIAGPQSIVEPACDCFPKTEAVFVGKESDERYFYQALFSILKVYGIDVYTTVHQPNRQGFEFRSSNAALESNRLVSAWLRDCFFVQAGKENIFNYPYVVVPNQDYGALTFSRVKARYPEKLEQLNPHSEQEPWYGDFGGIADSQYQLHILSYLLTATPSIKNHRFQFTYNEGGNCLIGQSEGKFYALIGKNGLEASRMNLMRELQELGFRKNGQGGWFLSEVGENVSLTDEEMKLFFAKDLGIEPSQVIFVEQADYHLDMSMAIMEGKTVILNDSMAAYEYMKQKFQKSNPEIKRSRTDQADDHQSILIFERLKKLYEKGQKMKLVEDAAEEDLKQSGFTVIRVAGSFEDISQDHPENHATNLFNFLSLTTPSNQKVIIALGCSVEHQQAFIGLIKQHIKDFVQIHFLDQMHSEFLLSGLGGIHCITKCLPYQL